MDHLWRQRLDSRLHDLLKNIDLQQQSRIPLPRLQEIAFPKIGLLELVDAETYEKSYQELYLSLFHGGERERSDLIVKRLEDDFAGRRAGLAPYRIVGIRSPIGEAIGAAQFSVLMLAGGKYAVPYLQYIYVRTQNRRQDMSEVLHTLVLAVAKADAKATVEDRIVPFTLFETEPPNHGISQSSRTNATERTVIHTRSGSQAVMLRTASADTVISAHVQPGLEPEDEPLSLIWGVRPSPSLQDDDQYDIDELGMALLAAYYRSLRDEGFLEKNIALAERIAGKRCEGKQFVEIPLSSVTTAMYLNLDDDQNSTAVALPADINVEPPI